MTRVQMHLSVYLFLLMIFSIGLYLTIGKEVSVRNEFYEKCTSKKLIIMIELPNNKIAYRFDDDSQYILAHNKKITFDNYYNNCKALKNQILEW